MRIWVPPQIKVTSEVSVMTSCNPVINLASTMYCAITKNNDPVSDTFDGSYTITINNAFNQILESQDEIVFNIKRGLKTPISTETSASFRVTIYDSAGYEVNFVKSALAITMLQGLRIEDIAVTTDSNVVGSKSFHNITFETPVPFEKGFIA